ncbi:6-bladed beta-propeller [Parabacteroides sp. W1-Q-101]|uniref:6-bladed beta-propeller n=1 Tax=Parabacteroides TaxID=375288 RepID=UPI00202DB729|nr:MULTISPECIES: 6-bladed beta-propeller [Parabacteroides]MCM0718713.1 6-bladed beta-propeller [Parabacteroides sp. W1-Q-101]
MTNRWIYILVIALLSCHEQGNKRGMEMIIEDPAELATVTDVVKVRDTQHNNDDISIKNEFKSIEYVRIDNKKIIGKIIDIAFTKDYMFLMLSHDGGIMKYDRKGNFIKVIARVGEGPEQVNPHHIFVDENREKVYVMQFRRKHSIAVFSFEGKFLGNLEYPFDKIDFMLPLGDEVFFSFSESIVPLTDSLNYVSGMFDILGKKYYSRKSYVKQCDLENCRLRRVFFFSHKNSVLYKIGGINILYRAMRDTIVPAYYLDLKNPIRGEIYQLAYSSKEYTNSLDGNNLNYIFINREGFFETDSCLYLRYASDRGGTVLRYNKSRKQTNSYAPKITRVLGVKNDIDNGVPIWPLYHYAKENIYVQTLSGGEIQDLKDLNYFNEQAPAVYRDMNEDSNPLVIIYKCN